MIQDKMCTVDNSQSLSHVKTLVDYFTLKFSVGTFYTITLV